MEIQPERSKFDWEKVHEQLDALGNSLATTGKFSPERAKTIMDSRAADLACAQESAKSSNDLPEAVHFKLNDESFALESRFVHEVIRHDSVTPVPGAPEVLSGVINLRGEILAIMDLRRLFHLKPVAPTDHSRIMVIGESQIEFGIVVDSVTEVAAIELDRLHDPPGSLDSGARDIVLGVTKEALMVIDGDSLMVDPRLTVEI